MYRLTPDVIDKLIVACNRYLENNSDILVRKDYRDIIKKLEQYKEQNC